MRCRSRTFALTALAVLVASCGGSDSRTAQGVEGTDRTRVPQTRRSEPEPARFLEGALRVPEATPADEEVVVVLERSKGGSVRTAPRHRLFPHLEYSRAPVASDGSFQIEVPSGRTVVRLDLIARYLYLAEPVLVEAEQLGEPVTLDARLGGILRLHLLPAKNTAFDPAVVVGRRVALPHRPDGHYFWTGEAPHVEASIGSDLTIEATALRPGWVYELEAARFDDLYAEDLGLGSYAPPIFWDGATVEPGRIRDVTLPLVDGLRLFGHVRDEDGGPVPGAEIRLEFKEGNTTTTHWLEANVLGTFRCVGAHPSLRTISASHDGFRTTRLRREELGALERIEIRLARAE